MKKSLKKGLMLILAVVALSICFVFGVSAETEYTEGYYTYILLDETVANSLNDVAAIVDVDDSISGEVIIPTTLGGYDVTAISYEAFYNCDEITSIIIPESVTSIGNRAFADCHSLANIIIPDSVVHLWWDSFVGTAYYNDATNWNKGALYIGNHLIKFTDYKVESYVIREHTTTICGGAFTDCTNLINVTIPESVVSIDNSAFEGCTSFKDLIIPENTMRIGAYAFQNCANITVVEIPDKVEEIGAYAFENCISLTKVVIGKKVTAIDYDAFRFCSNLEIIDIPDIPIKINDGVFSGTAYFNNEANWNDGCLYIGNHLVATKWDLKDCKIREGTLSLSGGVFAGLQDDEVFIPDSVKTIGRYAFGYSHSLERVVISKGVTEIEVGAFTSCSKLKKIIVDENNEFFSSDEKGVLFNKDKSVLLLCPKSVTEYTIPDSVVKIAWFSFNSSENLNSVIIGNNVEVIGRYAFSGCRNLKNVIIPEGVKSIGFCAFSACLALEEVKIPNTVRWLQSSLFSNCTSLKSVEIPSSVVAIDTHAFSNCTSLKSVDIPSSVVVIGAYTFYDCMALSEVKIGENVSIIDDYAFKNCCSIQNIEIPDMVKSIGNYAFNGCTKLLKVSLGQELKEIGHNAFEECVSLIDVFYDGCIGNWNNIEISHGNEPLLEATISLKENNMSAWSVDYTASCTDTGRESRYCTYNCGHIEYKDISATGHSMSGWTELYPATCTESGSMYNECFSCGYTEYKTTKAKGHRDGDSDNFCDNCGVETGKAECSCGCHKGGFNGLIYKLLRFFWKLFKINQYCSCGAAHY